MAIGDFFNSTVNVRRQSATKDATRGPLSSEPVLYASIAARVEDSGGAQVFVVGGLNMISTHRIYMADPGGPILNGDVIEETAPVANPNYYRVINPQIRRGLGSIPTYLALDATEFAPG